MKFLLYNLWLTLTYYLAVTVRRWEIIKYQEHLVSEFKASEDTLQKVKSSYSSHSRENCTKMLEISFKFSVSHLNHIILSWDDENPLVFLNPEWWNVFENGPV